jgi:DNA-directed RNA polymerase specialized sigma24 family protein
VGAESRPEAFDAFFDRMWPPCVRLARRVVGDSDAEDVAVEAFARALERWRKVGGLAYLDAWAVFTEPSEMPSAAATSDSLRSAR